MTRAEVFSGDSQAKVMFAEMKDGWRFVTEEVSSNSISETRATAAAAWTVVEVVVVVVLDDYGVGSQECWFCGWMMCKLPAGFFRSSRCRFGCCLCCYCLAAAALVRSSVWLLEIQAAWPSLIIVKSENIRLFHHNIIECYMRISPYPKLGLKLLSLGRRAASMQSATDATD